MYSQVIYSENREYTFFPSSHDTFTKLTDYLETKKTLASSKKGEAI